MVKNIDLILRNNLKSIRSWLGITQQALAQEVGVLINIHFQRTGRLLEKLTIDRLFYIEEQKQPQDQC